MFENNPDVPTEKLLSQIKGACIQGTSGNIDQMSLIMPPFSALLVRISNEASKTADNNLKVQNKMILLTSIILAISIVQAFIAFSQISNEAPVNAPSVVSTPQSIYSNEDAKTMNQPQIKNVHSNPQCSSCKNRL